MNQNSLAIYSFLMAKDLQFSRICHDPYQTHSGWKQVLKKVKTEASFPKCVPFQEEEGERFLLLLVPEGETPAPPKGWETISDANRELLGKLLRCQPDLLSPLGLFFEEAHRCVVQADSALCREHLWWLCPCSQQSSVLMTPETVLQQFLPEIGVKVVGEEA